MKKMIGLLLCLGSAAVVAGAWAYAHSGETSTDNAHVRGDVTSLAPKVLGYVTAVEVQDNQTVQAGDVLFRIDDRDYRARLAQAVANVEAAQARLTNAVSRAQVDESDAALSKAEAAVSAAATIEAQRQRIPVLTSQREAAAAAVAPVAQAQAARDLAQIDLDNTVVHASVDGGIGIRQVRIGRLVAPGVSLLDIVPVRDVWVVASFKETQVEPIRPGQRVRIKIDGYPDLTLAGVADSFEPGSGSAFSMLPTDNATGNFVRVVQRVPVKIRFAYNPLPGRIVPGLSARVDVYQGSGS